MNPFFLLLGLFGLATSSGSSPTTTTTASGGKIPKIVDDNPDDDTDGDMDMGGDDGGMDMGGDDGGMDMGGDDGGMDMGGDDGGMDMGGDDGGMDMGGDDGGMDMGGDDGGMDMGGDDGGMDMGGDDGGMDMGGDDGGMDMGGDDGGMDMGGDDGGMDMGGDDGGMDMGGDDGGMDMGGDDGGMDMGGDDGGMDMGGDDGGMDMGGDDGGMDMGGDDGGMDMGGDDGGMDMGGDDGGMDMGGDDHSGHDHTPPQITPPGVGASQAEISTYLNELANLEELHIHDHGDDRAGEHGAAMDLVDRGDATHVAIGDGDWFDPAIWANGEVPDDDARVLIPDGVTVDYGSVSDARLFTVRVDGNLDFATDASSQMIFDTMVVSPSGHLIIGTASDPVQANVDVDLIVASNGPIDTNWDPQLLSRGLIAHGETTIYGAEKDSHEKVSEDPMAGDNSVTFDAIPTGWQVGDTIVIAGTTYQDESQDEVRIITSIDGNRVFFEDALVHNHDAPREDLATSVANYTRNVSIESEEGAEAEIFERGHVMFMHSDDVDVHYMEFTELGRTDKSIDSQNVNDIGSVNFDSNVQGRYSLHLHRTGLGDQENPAILEGNAVFGSPGWGLVQHDSNADLTNNATFDTFGSGFVAETGNETGTWDDNIAIFAEGIAWGANPKNTSEINSSFDTGRGGEGFWFQGRLIEATNNVAASVNTGFVFFHRDGDSDGMIDLDSSTFAYEDALFGMDEVDPDKPAILNFSGNEAFGAFEGLHVVKATTLQGHDVWTELEDFTSWSVIRGVNLEYTAHYRLVDFDLVGNADGAQEGIYLHNNVSEIVIDGAQVSGFQAGIDLHKEFIDSHPASAHQYIVIDANVADNDVPIRNYDPSLDVVTTSNALPGYAPDLQINSMNYDPNDANANWISIDGTKTDSVGVVDFPGGIENMDIPAWDAAEVINNYGYYTTSGGQDFMLLDIYFTDRGTGTVYYETHPVMLSGIGFGTSVNGGDWLHTPFNGVQDIVTQGGTTMVGDRVLYEAIEAVPYSGISATASETHSAMAHETMSLTASAINTNYDMDIASNDTPENTSEEAVTSSRTMAVFETVQDIGLVTETDDETEADTTDDDVMDEGALLAFAPIDEQGAVDDANEASEPVTLELAGISASSGNTITQLSDDDLAEVLRDAGLGEQNACITIDYENDRVSMTLSDGDGSVTVETIGDQAASLWNCLTAEQGVVTDDFLEDEEDEDFLTDAA